MSTEPPRKPMSERQLQRLRTAQARLAGPPPAHDRPFMEDEPEEGVIADVD
jgi:hypothetical protein